MSKPTPDEKKWIAAWRSAETALEKIHAQELREFDYAERREIVLGLLQLGYQFRRPRATSGLVEMQRLFRKART